MNHISELFYISGERKEEECRKCKENNGKFNKECGQSLETEFQTGCDLHKVFVKCNEFGEFQSGCEYSKGHNIIVIIIDQKCICDSDINIATGRFDSFDQIPHNHIASSIQNQCQNGHENRHVN